MVTISRPAPKSVDILILGAGWTSTFLIPLLEKEHMSYAATSTTGRDETYKFKFDDKDDNSQYEALPSAKTVLITFPLKGPDQSTHLVKSYTNTHDESHEYQFIQLGSTGIYTIPGQDQWVTRHSKYNTKDVRAIAEDELKALGGCILNLSGLWGGQRDPRHWIDRVASTKEQLSGKGSLHMVHGLDVARGIIAVHQRFSQARGERFDEKNGSDKRANSQIKWIGELMEERKVRALPRSMEQLERCYDSREFWNTFGLMPSRSRL